MSTWILNDWIEPMKLKRLSDIRRKELRQAAFAVLEREGIAGATLEKWTDPKLAPYGDAAYLEHFCKNLRNAGLPERAAPQSLSERSA